MANTDEQMTPADKRYVHVSNRAFFNIRGLLAGASLLLCACAVPITRLQMPRTIPPGRTQTTVGISIQQPVSKRMGVEGLGTSHPMQYVPQFILNELTPALDVSVRQGLAERVDLGVRVRPWAVEAGPKIQLVRDEIEVSIAPAVLAAREAVLDSDIEPSPDNNVGVLALRTSIYLGSSVDHVFAVFLAPSLDAGERTFDTDSQHSHTDALVVPSVLGGIVFSPPQQIVRFLLEAGVSCPVGGSANFTGSYTSYPLRLGPGDNRFEITAALVFGSPDGSAKRSH